MKILKHIVMWKFLDNAEGKTKAENMRFAAENLRALVGVAPTLLKLSVGEDVLGSPASFDMALVADFTYSMVSSEILFAILSALLSESYYLTNIRHKAAL